MLLLGALALTASTGAASAATVLSLDGYCNAYAMRVYTGGLVAMKDTGCSNGYGAGLVASVRGDGKTTVMALTDPGNTTTQFAFKFSYPFATGGTWTLYSTTNGAHVTTVLSGTYTVPSGGERGVPGKTSITAP
jgi:hypothetical protein